MVTLKPKVTLKVKGESAAIEIKRLIVSLKWKSEVDLDLMGFFKAKDGRVGGVVSDGYKPGSMGSLASFPFMQLSGDEGVGATGGDNQEIIRIEKLDEMLEVYIVAVNYTDTLAGTPSIFGQYDGVVTVLNEVGETIEVPLDSLEPGNVVVICKIDNSGPIGPRLINMNDVMDLSEFDAKIPGTSLVLNS
jgi:tellurite resistance protein TerA